MAIEQLEREDLHFASQELDEVAPEPGDLGLGLAGSPAGHESPWQELVSSFSDLVHNRRFLFGLSFVGGLFLGWLVIGWWLWPVKWTNSDPWQLSQKHQKTYISLVAENYWWTKDLQRARDALAGWDDDAVTALVNTMEREASSTEARQQFKALAEALEIPTAAERLWASLLSEKIIFLSAILSGLPLVAAVVLGVSSLVRSQTPRAEGLVAADELLAEAVEAMLAEEEMLLEDALPEGDQEQEQQEEEDRLSEKESAEAEEEEAKNEEEEEDEFEEDEEEEEAEPWVQDLVSLMLDEDDTEFSTLEAFCKTLPDVDVSALLDRCIETADQLHKGRFATG